MDRQLEGTIVLETLAGAGKLEAFMEAVDTDDFETANDLMKLAGIDADTIATVLAQMSDPDG